MSDGYNGMKTAATVAGLITGKFVRACRDGFMYLHGHRHEIATGAKVATRAAAAAATGMAGFAWDAASLKIFDDERLGALKNEIETQGDEYRRLVIDRMDGHRFVDSLAVGGDLLADIIRTGEASPEVLRAYAAAYPDLAAHTSFAEAVRSYDSSELAGFISGVKGKLFEMQYTDWLNDGNLPEGYMARLAELPNQPGWDIAVSGPDGHVAQLLQMKATDSVEYVQHALERYPDIDVVTTDEVYSHLVLNGAADHVASSGISDAHLTDQVISATDGSAYSMHWTPPIISLALIAFTAYTLKDADVYGKARHFGERAGKSYIAYLIGGGVMTLTQTWWLGLLAGVGSRFLAARGRNRRKLYLELREVKERNGQLIQKLYQEGRHGLQIQKGF